LYTCGASRRSFCEGVIVRLEGEVVGDAFGDGVTISGSAVGCSAKLAGAVLLDTKGESARVKLRCSLAFSVDGSF
jgi:hypothetical protein